MDLFGEAIIEDAYDDDDVVSPDESYVGVTSVAAAVNRLKAPRQSDILIGHGAIETECLRLWQSNRMPHAVILSGLQGIGKATFAYRLARFILKESKGDSSDALFGGDAMQPTSLAVAHDDPVFAKVASGGHPDLFTVERPFDEKTGKYKNEIPVDEIRKVAPFMRKTSGEGGWRIVIIDDANMMNRNGQNALLKILEEPPKKALLILVTHGAGGLLPTIRSRCRFISMEPLVHDDMVSLIKQASDAPIMPDDLDILTALADGSAGQAIRLMQEGGIEHIHTVLEALTTIKTLSAAAIDDLALSYGKSGDQAAIDHFVYIVNWWLETLIYMAAGKIERRDIGGLTIRVPEGHNLPSLLRLHEDVTAHIDTCINGTLDKRYMIYKTLRIVQGA